MESGRAVRNLDEIQEADPDTRPSRGGALLVASLGGAALVLAAVLVLSPGGKGDVDGADPLGDLVAKAGSEGSGERTDRVSDVTFPRLLSDQDRPTTALEVVRDRQIEEDDPRFALPPGAPTLPPPATDRLPVVPLPAQHVLSATAETQPSDMLTSMAQQVSRESGQEVEAGQPGGFQLQVSSFKKKEDADSFASALRRRGHKAYVEAANVKDRGLWHRVRIGPFKHKRSAVIYRQEFEAKERIVTFIVSPPKNEVVLRD
jgi:DedD protein